MKRVLIVFLFAGCSSEYKEADPSSNCELYQAALEEASIVPANQAMHQHGRSSWMTDIRTGNWYIYDFENQPVTVRVNGIPTLTMVSVQMNTMEGVVNHDNKLVDLRNKCWGTQ